MTSSRTYYYAAGTLGTVHGVFSLYWASGGLALLDTVGEWAIELVTSGSRAVMFGLGIIGVVKILAAWLPLLIEAGRLPGRRAWRPLFWIAAIGLTAYGVVNTVVALAVLANVISVAEINQRGLIGHAFLWDPLFALWGMPLLAALSLSRTRASEQATRSQR